MTGCPTRDGRGQPYLEPQGIPPEGSGMGYELIYRVGGWGFLTRLTKELGFKPRRLPKTWV